MIGLHLMVCGSDLSVSVHVTFACTKGPDHNLTMFFQLKLVNMGGGGYGLVKIEKNIKSQS